MRYVLGIDIGTSGTKTVLYNENCDLIADAVMEYALYQPKNGWAEQNPADWVNATIETIKKVVENNSDKNIVGVGLSGQMHGLVLLDKNNKVLTKSIIWCDTRADSECSEILLTMPDYKEYTKNPPIVGFTLPKLLWVKNNLPEIYAQIHKILLPKDYVNFCLCGNFTTDVSDASGTGFFDVKNRCWSGAVLTAFDIKEEWLPKVLESQEVSGKLTDSVAELTGLNNSVIVVAGAGDQAAAALGNGIISSGEMSITLGSSGVVFAATSQPLVDKKGSAHTFCHAVPNMWHIMGVTQGAGISIKWFKSNFANELTYKQLDEGAEKSLAGSRGLVFLPYLMGERTPHLDSNIRGAFIGLSAMHNTFDLYRAVLEGVAFSLKDCYSLIKELGINVTSSIIGGGGAKSDIWKQIIADILCLDLISTNNGESGTKGVAMLAMVGANIYDNLSSAFKMSLSSLQTKETKAVINKKYNSVYGIYKNLYFCLKDSNKNLLELANNDSDGE